MSKNKYLILEYSEFDAQRLNSDSTPMAVAVTNPELSSDGYDKHEDILRQQNVRLNNILHNVFLTAGQFKTGDRNIIDGQDFSDLRILRIVPKDINITIYFAFFINDNEYFGVIDKFDTEQPEIDTEAFRDRDLYQNIEWVIRTKGLVMKVIKTWMAVSSGEYKALKDIEVYNNKTGNMSKIKVGSIVTVLRSTYDNISVEVNGDVYQIKGRNYYYFNYYFEPIED